jgi:hypothetical protein
VFHNAIILLTTIKNVGKDVLLSKGRLAIIKITLAARLFNRRSIEEHLPVIERHKH